ncbi:DET1- and DDB1-associated protein 1 [Galendromus occidentalis]|uniref:DET1- and DDB1-associated protein 1 n=1 Tax=Galendromus occidentalis TaxID=34638 RepID=A0AAJ6QP32_9ACAR|nr:DET1- and DDB1-associated protein 1 [Galendromus occidentalis]
MANVMRNLPTKTLFSAGPSCSSEGVEASLSNLPSFNSRNFAKFQPCSQSRNSTRKPPTYLPLKDHPLSQTITTEKTNILLRYLHYQTGGKKSSKRRDASPSEDAPRKRNREDQSTDMDTNAERSDDD